MTGDLSDSLDDWWAVCPDDDTLDQNALRQYPYGVYESHHQGGHMMADEVLQARGLRGELSRVVLVYPERHPDDCFAFGTVDGDNWYGVSVSAKPGMYFDGTNGMAGGFLPMSAAYRFVRSMGRVEEVVP
jgi:hypothetical protein